MTADQAWAAGLFEGEGSFSGKTTATKFYSMVSLESTDQDVVKRFHRVVGVGGVCAITPRRDHKPVWRWQTQRLRDVIHVMLFLGGALSERRLRRAAEVLRRDSRQVAWCG